MIINLKMLPMKIHYFVRFAGTGPLTPFLPVIARQKGVSAQVVGVIWTILPLLSPMIKTTAGAIADCSRSHRAVFLGGIVVMLASLSGLYWTPHIPSPCFNNTLIGSLNASKSSLNPQGSLTSRHSWPNASEMLSGDPDEGEAVTNVSTGPQGAKICPSSSHTHTVYSVPVWWGTGEPLPVLGTVPVPSAAVLWPRCCHHAAGDRLLPDARVGPP
ncbi:hypothetical protein OTU49_011237 [Cherax quadricarinatus]|uniref:Major facilitator superfamily associated domain-containing protein n=1 Tax=Cherax quadricarinatus TaxID=27406 RepID=A0AAW0W3U4_CHEQU